MAEAFGLYRQLVQVAPQSADAWRGLAVTANQMAERSTAERALRRYLQLRPNAGDAAKILQGVSGTR
jgi:Tfp pilus assembly protein PilF